MNIFTALFADHDASGHMGDWGGGWMLLWGPLMMIGFAVVVVWLFRVGNSPARREPTNRALETLAERYARGELSTEEYRERFNELR